MDDFVGPEFCIFSELGLRTELLLSYGPLVFVGLDWYLVYFTSIACDPGIFVYWTFRWIAACPTASISSPSRSIRLASATCHRRSGRRHYQLSSPRLPFISIVLFLLSHLFFLFLLRHFLSIFSLHLFLLPFYLLFLLFFLSFSFLLFFSAIVSCLDAGNVVRLVGHVLIPSLPIAIRGRTSRQFRSRYCLAVPAVSYPIRGELALCHLSHFLPALSLASFSHLFFGRADLRYLFLFSRDL